MRRILDTPHRYHIDHAHRTIYIWCSGTYSWASGFRNFDLCRRRAYGRKINARDLAETRAIWGALTATESRATEYEVVAMGYSLGGALAVYDVMEDGSEVMVDEGRFVHWWRVPPEEYEAVGRGSADGQ